MRWDAWLGALEIWLVVHTALSWLPRADRSRFLRAVLRVSDPLSAVVRRLVSVRAAGLDLAPLVAWVALDLVRVAAGCG